MEKELKKQIEIPEYVVLTKDRESFEGTFQNGLSGLRACYEKLREIEDLQEVIPDAVQDIKPEPVNSFINERIAEIVTTKMLTVDAKERAKGEWEDIRKNSLSFIERIQNFFTNYPSAEFALVGETLVCTNTNEVAFEHCKRRVPREDVTRLYDLILNVRKAIDALWAFEREHEWPSESLVNVEMDLRQLDKPDELAKNWVYREWLKEYRKQHPYLDDAYRVARKSNLAEQNASLAELRKKHLEEHPEDFVDLGSKSNPYERMQRGRTEDCLDYSVEMK